MSKVALLADLKRASHFEANAISEMKKRPFSDLCLTYHSLDYAQFEAKGLDYARFEAKGLRIENLILTF